jgi:hypothetical protein
VSRVEWKDDTSSDFHQWLTWDVYSVDSNALGTGDTINGMTIRPAAALSMGRFTRPAPTPSAVKLSPCKYNFGLFKQCLTDETAKYAVPGGLNTGKKCNDFLDELIETCKEKSKGCTPLQ